MNSKKLTIYANRSVANTITPSHLYPAPDPLIRPWTDPWQALAFSYHPSVTSQQQGRHQTSDFLVHSMLYTFSNISSWRRRRWSRNKRWEYPWAFFIRDAHAFGRNRFFSLGTYYIVSLSITDERSGRALFTLLFFFAFLLNDASFRRRCLRLTQPKSE